MPRIRSIHPGFWTDEDVVSISRDARLLFIGLWNQCDDHGAFEWKPVTLKMQLFPADPEVDIVALLAELTRVNLVRAYLSGGRKFGGVRNFRRYQKPKKPRAKYPMPEAISVYSDGDTKSAASSEPVPHRSGTPSPGKGKGRGSRSRSPPPSGVGEGGNIRNGFAASALDDMRREANDHAEQDDAHPRGAKVVPIARRADRC
jgi:hypothetical protein